MTMMREKSRLWSFEFCKLDGHSSLHAIEKALRDAAAAWPEELPWTSRFNAKGGGRSAHLAA